MAIPEKIRAVQRPKNTVVKQRGARYVVVRRTSRRVGKRVLPVDLETVGEIVNGTFVERSKKPAVRTIDIKDYGEVALCDRHGRDLLQELARVWEINDSKRLYVLALLRAAYGDIKNRDVMMQYDTSFVSEFYPGVHLSEQAISAFLQEIGQGYSLISSFMRNRVRQFIGKDIIIDGMLKDYNSSDGYLSEFSRKARTKGSKDLSLMYAYSPELKEPIAAKPYPGNMPDNTAVLDFVRDFKIERGLMIMDKGFWSESLFEEADRKDGMSYIVPLKQNSAFIKKYGMDNPAEHLAGYKDATILFKKRKMKNGNFLYSFRNPKMTYEQEVGYVLKAEEKGAFDSGKYSERKSLFGLIVFKSKSDLDPLTVYEAYAKRWQIEVIFNLYKNIIDHTTVNVHTDYRVYATELINFLSTIIAVRVKNEIVKKGINKDYSYKQVFKYLSKYKRVRTKENGKWKPVAMVKYIEALTCILDV